MTETTLETPTALAPGAEKGTGLDEDLLEDVPTSPEESQPTSLDMALGAPDLEDLPGIVDPIIEMTSEDFFLGGGAGGTGGWPVQGEVSQGFGGKAHLGMDIAVPVGTPVASPISGTIIGASYIGTWGNQIRVKGDDGQVHLMAHLSRFAAKVGQRVQAGQVIAYSGNTGRSTGPHVHWEIWAQGGRSTAIDPMDWAQANPSNNLGASGAWTAKAGDPRAVTQNAYQLMRQVGATHEEARFLASVVMPESGGNPGIVNSIGATGLWQILYPVHRSWLNAMGLNQQSLKNPLNNARAALRIYRDRLPKGRAWAEAAWEVTRLNGGRHLPYLQYV